MLLYLLPFFLVETIPSGSSLPLYIDFKDWHNRDSFDKHYYKDGRAFHLDRERQGVVLRTEQKIEVTPTKLILG